MDKQKQKVKVRKDLTGKVFGMLTVIEQAEDWICKDGVHRAVWKCRCSCENQTIINVAQISLKSGLTVSCGCFGKEKRRKALTKHDKTNTRLFRVWNNIKRRCYTKTDPSYKYYGERGIKICDDWLSSFQSFYDWAYANGYDENAKKGQCTIDRINVNGDYEPSNCRWVSMKEQNKNKRNSVYGKEIEAKAN